MRRMRGAVIAEFSVSLVIFLGVLFFALEALRMLYLLNALQESTRRAAHLAAVSDFSNPAALDAIRQAAVMRNSPGAMPLGAPVTDAHIQIDYLSLTRQANGSMTLTPIPAASLPACPARAHLNCIANPYGASCIRFVRARLCAPNLANCGAVTYQPLFPMVSVNTTLSQAATVVKAESLGYQPGAATCP